MNTIKDVTEAKPPEPARKPADLCRKACAAVKEGTRSLMNRMNRELKNLFGVKKEAR